MILQTAAATATQVVYGGSKATTDGKTQEETAGKMFTLTVGQ